MSVLARVYEDMGLVTTGLVLIEEHAKRVKPPRMLSVPFNFGNTLGRPNDPEFQHEILKTTFDLLDRHEGPVLESFSSNIAPELFSQGSGVPRQRSAVVTDPGQELGLRRPFYERWVQQNGGRTAVGLSTISQTDFKLVIKFLEDFIEDEEFDTPIRPNQFSGAHFIRYCVDDLKAYYFESKMSEDAEMSIAQLHEWLWAETALGSLIMRLAERMRSDDNNEVKAVAFGIAR